MKLKQFIASMAAAMALGAIAETYKSGEQTWTFDITGSSATITDVKNAVGAVEIPATVSDGSKTYTVTKIDSWSLAWCFGMTSVTIPATVTEIADGAFEDDIDLVSIVVAAENPNYSSANGLLLSKDGTTLIQGVGGKVTIPSTVTTIARSAFERFTTLESVTIPASVKSIEDSAFYDCDSLTSVAIPDSVTEIDNYAFAYCDSLASVTLPDSISAGNIGFAAFCGTPGLADAEGFVILRGILCAYCGEAAEVTIPDGVTKIGGFAFSENESLRSVTIPGSVTEIDGSAFEICYSLASVKIPDSVVTIGEAAFLGCNSLKVVTIPASVTEIGQAAFDCVEAAFFEGDAPDMWEGETYVDEAFDECKLYVKKGTRGWGDEFPGELGDSTLYYAPEFKIVDGVLKSVVDFNGTTEIVIPESVTEIANYAFFTNTTITGVNFPTSVKKVGIKAFKGCENLEYANFQTLWGYDEEEDEEIPLTSLDTLGQAAFQNCTSLIWVELPPLGDNYLWSSTFEGCSTLTDINLPDGLTGIGTSAFANCRSLTQATIPDTVKDIKSFAFFTCESLEYVELPRRLKTIGEKAFKNCTAMTEIELQGITTLGKAAFFNSGLEEVYVPGSVGKVDDYCFQKCANLYAVELGEGITETGASVWANDDNLAEVYLPSTLEKLGAFAFFRCPELYEVCFTGCSEGEAEPQLEAIGEKAFKHCSSLDELILPSGVTALPKEMCNYCASLVEVSGTENVTTFAANAFSNCPALETVAGLSESEVTQAKKGQAIEK